MRRGTPGSWRFTRYAHLMMIRSFYRTRPVIPVAIVSALCPVAFAADAPALGATAGRPAVSAPQMPQRARGTVVGAIRDLRGRPLAGVCVSTAGAATPVALSGADGMFALSGVTAGLTDLRYWRCDRGAGQPGVAGAVREVGWAPGAGSALVASSGARVLVPAGSVAMIGTVTVQPERRESPSLPVFADRAHRLRFDQVRAAGSGQASGGIPRRRNGPPGRPIRGLVLAGDPPDGLFCDAIPPHGRHPHPHDLP